MFHDHRHKPSWSPLRQVSHVNLHPIMFKGCIYDHSLQLVTFHLWHIIRSSQAAELEQELLQINSSTSWCDNTHCCTKHGTSSNWSWPWATQSSLHHVRLYCLPEFQSHHPHKIYIEFISFILHFHTFLRWNFAIKFDSIPLFIQIYIYIYVYAI